MESCTVYRVPISVILITRNAESRLCPCLESVSWADEIIVVDAESKDSTVRIAESLGAKVFIRKWEGYVSQRRFAVDQAEHDWILSLDADEIVSPELAAEIQKRVGLEEVAGYRINRLNHFLGKPVRHSNWAPDWVLRCFRKDGVRLPDVAIHEGFEVDGKIGKLEGNLLHFSYDSLEAYFEKMNAYTSLEVADKTKRRKDKSITVWDFIFRPASRFWRMFIVKKGFRDGLTGFLVCTVSSIYLLSLYAKVWESQKNKRPAA